MNDDYDSRDSQMHDQQNKNRLILWNVENIEVP